MLVVWYTEKGPVHKGSNSKWKWFFAGWKRSYWGSFVIKWTSEAYQNDVPRTGSGAQICDFRHQKMAKVMEKTTTSNQAFIFATACLQLLPGNSQSSFPQAEWHSRRKEGCWREPSHKPPEPHSSGLPHGTASSARIPEVPPPHSLQKEKQLSSAMSGSTFQDSICQLYVYQESNLP